MLKYRSKHIKKGEIMYIEKQLSTAITKLLEQTIMPDVFNLFDELVEAEDFKNNHFKSKNSDFNISIQEIKTTLTEDEEKEHQNKIALIEAIKEKESDELSFDSRKIIRKLKEDIEIKTNKYIHIYDENNHGYIIFKQDDLIECYKTYPEFQASDELIKDLSLKEYIELANKIGREHRNVSDSSFVKYPKKPDINYFIDNVLLNDEFFVSIDPIFSFENALKFKKNEKNEYIDYNEIESKKFLDIKEFNDVLNHLSVINNDFLSNDINIEKNILINAYNNENKKFKEALNENIKLKFNQIYNIMEDRFKGIREDFQDLNNHISVISLKNMPNNRCIFMESQNRNLLAIEKNDGNIDIYKMAEKEGSENSLDFSYKYELKNKNGHTEKKILENINSLGAISDDLSVDHPSYLSLDYFIHKYDGTQNVKETFSTSDNFVMSNILNDNMTYGLLTQTQRFLCHYQNIPFDTHKDIDVFSLNYIINKNSFLFKKSSREKELFNIFWESDHHSFNNNQYDVGEGTDIPFNYPKSENDNGDFYISWFYFEKTKLADSIPLDIKKDFFNGIKECFENVKKYYESNPDKIENIDVYNTVIEKVSNNIKKVENNKNKKLKKQKNR